MSESDRVGAARVSRRTLLGMLAVGATGLLAACAPASTAPAAAPAPPTSAPAATAAKPPASPAAAGSPAASPAAAPSAVASVSPVVATKPAAGSGRWGMTAEQEAAWAQVEAAGNKEGEFTYYGTGNVAERAVPMMQELWTKEYPGIKMNYLFLGGATQAYARIQAEQESKTYVCDCQDGAQFNILRQEPPGSFQAQLPPAASDPTAKWWIDPLAGPPPRGLFVGTTANHWPIWINTNMLAPADRPKGYQDLVTNPKYKGQILFRNPWQSGGGNHVFRFTTEAYGVDWAQKMKAQEPGFQADQDQALVQVARGEYAIGIGLTGRTATQLLGEGLPIAAVWPDDLGIYSTIGYAVATGAPHANAARVFVNWTVTPLGQKFHADLGYVPFRTDVPSSDVWTKGYESSRVQKEVDTTNEQLQTLSDQATAIFKN
jgi:iron(III) transport system substrate-binding protein